MSLVYLAVAIVSEVLGSVCLRVASAGQKKFYAAVVVSYPISLFMLVRALQEGMGIGVAYGIWAAAGVALTALVSRFLFAEPITKKMALGMMLISAGVVLIETGGHA